MAHVLIILFGWWHGSGTSLGINTSSTLLALGRLAGLVLASVVLMQFLMMSRARWIEAVFGLDKVSRIHRWNGYVAFGLLFVHPLLIVLAYALAAEQTVLEQVWQFVTQIRSLRLASIGYALLLIVVGTSLAIVRRRWRYEMWYFVHLLNYVAIVLVFFHQQELGGDFAVSPLFTQYWTALYVFVFTNVLLFRFLRPLYLFGYQQWRVERVVAENHNVNSVYITGRHLDHFPIQAGQFMRVQFLQRGFWWQSHPFSLSIGPNGRSLRITPKAVGDFTSQIPQLKPGTLVLLDGPFGTFMEEPTTRQKVLLLAGGIGLTPLRSLAESMVTRGKDLVLLNANRTPQDIVLADELIELSRRGSLRVIDVISDNPSFPGERGRLDADRIKRLVPDVAEREVFLCGPVPMMKALLQALATLGVPSSRIHYERFAL